MLELLVLDHFSVKDGTSKKPLFRLVGTAVGLKAHIQEIEQVSAGRLARRAPKHLHRLRVCKKNVAARGVCDDDSAWQLLEDSLQEALLRFRFCLQFPLAHPESN